MRRGMDGRYVRRSPSTTATSQPTFPSPSSGATAEPATAAQPAATMVCVRREQQRDGVPCAGRPLQRYQGSNLVEQLRVERGCGRDPYRLLHFQRNLLQQRHRATAVRAPHLALLLRSAPEAPRSSVSDLRNNQLNGVIPSSLGNLTGLLYLCVHCAAERPCTR